MVVMRRCIGVGRDLWLDDCYGLGGKNRKWKDGMEEKDIMREEIIGVGY